MNAVPFRALWAVPALLLGAAAPGTTPVHAQVAQQPTLVVLITVDQLRPDYLTRFAPQFTGGFARLARGGAVFRNAFQDHAITETAPGHASLLSGRFPRSTYIVQNTIGVEDRSSPLIESIDIGASPRRFRGTTLTDWIKKADSRTRSLSISRKDRGAILTIGRAKETVLWWGPRPGVFTTSRWYADTLPTWVQRFNAREPSAAYAGRAWTPLLPDSAYAEPDSVPLESSGRGFVFPHVLSADSTRAAIFVQEYPWMDEITAAAALEGVRQIGLGRGPQTDLLAVSFSTTDAVGHRYGQDSKEMHDQILRLDRTLGAFIDSLYKLRDSSHIVIALTSDHGMAPYPGIKSPREPNEKAIFVPVWDTLRNALIGAASKGVDTSEFVIDVPFIYADKKAFARRGLKADSVIRALQRGLSAVPGVMRVETLEEVAKRDTTKDAIARRWLHMFPKDFPVSLVITLDPYNYWARGQPTHGSPHDYDAHVPLIFYGPPFTPGSYDEFVRTVDIGPTLAAVIGVKPIERLDGRVLTGALSIER